MTTTDTKAKTSNGSSIAHMTLAAHRILIHGKITAERELPARDGRPASKKFTQLAIITGGDRDLLWEVNTYDDPTKVLKQGVYMLGNNSLSVGQYSRLQLSTYADNLQYVSPMTTEQAKRFESQKADMSDIL